ncbi:MAG: NAD-dependent epimerase/dehydratase family protein [Chloroflexota bacterium]|nr:NAD-dependent epimerase/dehydratase family protein [Chloroflexota bacterium]
MRVLVIGGTNFIGPAVVVRLFAAGHHLTVFHRGGAAEDPVAHVSHVHGDRGTIDEFRADFARFAPDVVLDMAPMSGDDANGVMRACRGIAKRAVAISSVDVYRAYGRLHRSEPGPVEPVPLTEGSPLREQLYPYRGERNGKLDGYDKIPVEQAVMSDAELPGTVIRLPAVHGERDYQHRLFMELARMDASRPAILVQQDQMQWRWSRSYVGNCADAIALP